MSSAMFHIGSLLPSMTSGVAIVTMPFRIAEKCRYGKSMEATHGSVSHAMIGASRQIVDLDDGYAALLGVARAAVIGRPALDFTDSRDRDAAGAFLDAAWTRSGTQHGTHRHVHADGRSIWVKVWASRLGRGDAAALVVSCRPLRCLEASSPIQAQWQLARLLLQALAAGKQAFGPALVGNPAAEILLHTYVAEAEARSILAGEIVQRTGVAWPLASRWLLALIHAGFAETETGAALDPATPIRLSQTAHALLETTFGTLVAAIKAKRVRA